MRTLLLAGTALILAACGGVSQNAERLSNDARERTADYVERGPGGPASVRPGGAQVSDGVFLAAARERRPASENLPSAVQRANAVRLQSRDPMTLPEIAERLSEITGIPHIAALGSAGEYRGQPSTPATQIIDGTSTGDFGFPGMPAPEAADNDDRSGRGVISGRRVDDQPEIRIRPDLTGSLSDVLDEIASYFNASWTYTEGRIVLRDFVTRQYQVSVIPEGLVADDPRTDQWEEIEGGLSTIIGDGGNIAIGRSTGLVTVTARLSDHDRISRYLDQVNGHLGQQIAFDVHVLTVSSERREGYSINLNEILGQIGSAAVGFSGGGSGFSSPIGNVNVGVASADISVDAIMSALSTQGRVSIETRTGATTGNNRMVPISVLDERAYAARTQIREVGDAATVEITPDTVTTGFDLRLIPRVLNNREIMVEYAIQLSELDQIRQFGGENSRIELPEVNRTEFQQQALLNNGETLILAGFERNRVEQTEAGLGRSNWTLLGGGQEASIMQTVTVLMISPRLLDNRRAIDGRMAEIR